MQRLDDFFNWHHFQTVVANVLNFVVAYSRVFVLLDACKAERLFVLLDVCRA